MDTLNNKLNLNNPSLLNIFRPLVNELGKKMFYLQVSYSSSLNADEDYSLMTAQLTQPFSEAFINWGKFASNEGWGIFELPYYDTQKIKAKVVIHNPWELLIQKDLKESEQWGCPFLQGKIIGIFQHAFNQSCWADEQYFFDGDDIRVEFNIYADSQNIEDKIKLLRETKYCEVIGAHRESEVFTENYTKILKMIATGVPAPKVYDEIALMYEARHPGMRCSLLELKDGVLMHGGAPSMPKKYCDDVHGLKNGPSVGSCGTSTYFGQQVLVKDIATDPKWVKIKHVALPHGMRSCWSEPIVDSSGKVLGAFGMYYNYPALPNDKEAKDLISAARLAGIVMERDQSQIRIHKLAYTDELTQLANRAHFHKELKKLINTSNRNKNRLAVLYR